MGPIAAVGANRAALRIGTAPDIAVVATDTGRLVSRVKAPANVETLGASPDGTTLYYSSMGSIFSIPVGGGDARRIGAGDSFAVDPGTGDLIVRLNELERFRLVRLSPAGGTPMPIDIQSPFRLVVPPIAAGAIRNGRMLLPIASTDSWYWFLGVLDLKSGRLDKVSVDYFTDFHYATWTSDGRILGSGIGARSALWKFTPTARSR
jgi:hypothetical protein